MRNRQRMFVAICIFKFALDSFSVSGDPIEAFPLVFLLPSVFLSLHLLHSDSDCESQTVSVPRWRWFLFLGLYLVSLC